MKIAPSMALSLLVALTGCGKDSVVVPDNGGDKPKEEVVNLEFSITPPEKTKGFYRNDIENVMDSEVLTLEAYAFDVTTGAFLGCASYGYASFPKTLSLPFSRPSSGQYRLVVIGNGTDYTAASVQPTSYDDFKDKTFYTAEDLANLEGRTPMLAVKTGTISASQSSVSVGSFSMERGCSAVSLNTVYYEPDDSEESEFFPLAVFAMNLINEVTFGSVIDRCVSSATEISYAQHHGFRMYDYIGTTMALNSFIDTDIDNSYNYYDWGDSEVSKVTNLMNIEDGGKMINDPPSNTDGTNYNISDCEMESSAPGNYCYGAYAKCCTAPIDGRGLMWGDEVDFDSNGGGYIWFNLPYNPGVDANGTPIETTKVVLLGYDSRNFIESFNSSESTFDPRACVDDDTTTGFVTAYPAKIIDPTTGVGMLPNTIYNLSYTINGRGFQSVNAESEANTYILSVNEWSGSHNINENL